MSFLSRSFCDRCPEVGLLVHMESHSLSIQFQIWAFILAIMRQIISPRIYFIFHKVNTVSMNLSKDSTLIFFQFSLGPIV